jgi:hypothetical protein
LDTKVYCGVYCHRSCWASVDPTMFLFFSKVIFRARLVKVSSLGTDYLKTVSKLESFCLFVWSVG